MDSDEAHTIDDADDAAWVAAQRQVVVDYLGGQRLEHGGVSLEPRWFVAPYLAVWAVRSLVNPDEVGWWAVSGDVPTDYMTRGREQDAADVLIAFAVQWREAARLMALGQHPENCTIGDPTRAEELAPLLAARAELLHDFGKRIKSGEL